ncbi:MAG: GerW family sporulation protein [Candidatus Improbicoccus pseudotrichonymphae]|uniref:GerW family sporulation protein n=1 Tax=Candidatus Improbicoccus pseudotrichonymphae TaxID=3033792 RepID=A0AA48I2J8_9FIRM|nr:MAG: GerW family sporulation protein [Candidatus Improbicoccus pseudotrichonymphae]
MLEVSFLTNGLENLMETTLDKIRAFANVDSIIGSPIIVNSKVTLIPISKISYGFGSGGSDISSKKSENKNLFGGVGAGGVNVSPVAFVVINSGEVSLLQIDAYNGALDRAIATAPELIEKLINVLKKKFKKEKKGEKEATTDNE